MNKVITIKLSERESVEFYKDADRIVVNRLDEKGNGAAYGHLSQQQIKELIELLDHCNHEHQHQIDIPGTDERISVCEDCGTEVV